jgi:hypothetical protein
MNRFQAFAIHLTISLIIFLSFLALMFFVWYPTPYFDIDGGWRVLQILAGVDVVLGPLLTLIVFKSGKPRLKFDLTCIALVQLAALIYGASVIYQGHPVYTVFAIDRFSTVPANDVDTSQIKTAQLNPMFSLGPILAYVENPSDRKLAEQIMFEALQGGRDIDRHAELYQPYPPALNKLAAKTMDIGKLRASGAQAEQAIAEFLQDQGGSADDYFYYPLMGKNKDIVIALSKTDGMPAGYIDTDPWAVKR